MVGIIVEAMERWLAAAAAAFARSGRGGQNARRHLVLIPIPVESRQRTR